MSKFTKTIKFRSEFQGDQVTCAFRRLSRVHMAQITSMIDQDKVSDDGLPCEEDNVKMLGAVIDMLPEYIDGTLRGLTDADGNELGIEYVVNESFFFPLAAEMGTALMNSSAMTEEQEGNFDEPPIMLSKAQETSVGGS